MGRALAWLGLVAAMALGSCLHAAVTVQLHAPPRIGRHVLSYNGARMIVQEVHDGATLYNVVETASGRPLGLLQHSFVRAVWGENSDVAYAVAKDKQIYRLVLNGENVRMDRVTLTGPEAIPAHQAPRVLLFPSQTAPFLLVQGSRRHRPLYRCDLSLARGERELETRCRVMIEDGRSVVRWLTTAQGRIVARIKESYTGQRVFESLMPNGKWAYRFHFIPYYTVLKPIQFVQPDGTVWALSNRKRERVALVRLNIETGEEEVFFEHDRHDLTEARVGFDRDGEGAPLLVHYQPDYQAVVHFHGGLETAYEALHEKVGKPSRIDLVSMDRMAKTAVVLVENPRLYRSWYLLNLERNTSRELSASSLAWYPPFPSRPVTFSASDGLDLYGYLTSPRESADARPPPLIVMLHGGPWSRYFWPAPALVSFLASKGYAVLRLNFRGSTGYHRSFLAAGNGALFGSMQHDVLDAAEWAIANGHATPDGIALLGSSFGGFLTLVMLAHHPERFQAGIAINAVTDAVEFWRADWRRGSARVLWQEFFDTDVVPEVALAELSPINNFDRIVAPVQLIAGSRDRRVPPSHSHEMFHLLKESGKTVELVEFESASHSIWSTSRGSQIAASLAAFLEEHLGGTR